ncbi:hypothetical protein EJB05_23132, partial [Eragrostis curvula]
MRSSRSGRKAMTSVTTTFSKDHLIWGYSEFITRKNLESSPHLLNDKTRDCGKLMTKNLLPDRKESSFAFLTPGFLLRRSNKNVQALGSPSPGSHVPPAQ